MSNWALIVAAGKSERFGDPLPKQFHEVAGRPLLSWTIEKFELASSIDKIVVVVAADYQLETTRNIIDPFGFQKVAKVVGGGESRQESVLKGLEALPESTKVVAIHDGVRALVSPDDVDKVVNLALTEKAAMLALPATDTVKKVKNHSVVETLDRKQIWLAQTPQAFEYQLILDAHRNFAENTKGTIATDDASLVEALGVEVKVVESSSNNLKVTTAADLKYVEIVLGAKEHA
ncbi:MAG: 2-C-methyl-D-erythritol 4-phosphate cytidylyltransferase [candidate division Zixibacteria bacterium]|nr:2-C-methyl-D-erythritol 4-phosphate cytidylyltransferase [candidate division Zixibacteria bacterium]